MIPDTTQRDMRSLIDELIERRGSLCAEMSHGDGPESVTMTSA